MLSYYTLSWLYSSSVNLSAILLAVSSFHVLMFWWMSLNSLSRFSTILSNLLCSRTIEHRWSTWPLCSCIANTLSNLVENSISYFRRFKRCLGCDVDMYNQLEMKDFGSFYVCKPFLAVLLLLMKPYEWMHNNEGHWLWEFPDTYHTLLLDHCDLHFTAQWTQWSNWHINSTSFSSQSHCEIKIMMAN